MTVIAGADHNPYVTIAFGANSRPFLQAGEIWRLVASMFLHANVLHLLINGYALFLLGSNLEAFYGSWRFLFLYLGSGIAGSLASATFAEVVSVGASGGIFGLLGGSIVFAFKYRDILPPRVSRLMGTTLLPWVALNIALGILIPHVDMNAHLGGLLGGAVIAMFLTPRSLLAALGQEDPGAPRILSAVCGAVLIMTALAAGHNILRTRGPDGPVLETWQMEALGRIERDTVMDAVMRELEKRPESVEVLFIRAQILTQDGDWPAAIHDYRRVLELSPDNASALNNLAWILLEDAPPGLRDRPEARRLAERAYELDPRDAYILGTYGTVRLRDGEYAEAAELLQRSLERDRGRPDASTDRYLLAIALERLGRRDEAREEFRRAVRLDPEDPYRPEAESALGIQRDPSE